MEDLVAFIESNPDPRELKRAVAVRMTLQGYTHRQIHDVLQVVSGFISKWKQAYLLHGVEGLKLGHKGSKGYLTPEQRQQTIDWLKSKNYWDLHELEYYVAESFDVIFSSRTSYYELFREAGISWKKSQKYNPKANPELVEAKIKRLSPG
ncbi:MAG: transposase [Synechococcaceae cyanobacterium SM2_3_1]|nr:transposase [Synechococcaceae cyanobacterium SM2_3_1]